MVTKKMKVLGALLFGMACACTQSLAEDGHGDSFLEELALAKNSYVLNSKGEVEIAPDFKKITNDAQLNGHFKASATALIANNRNGDYQLNGKYELSCLVFPAAPFFSYVAEETQRTKSQPKLSLSIYEFIRDTKNFQPYSFMKCEVKNEDRGKWNKSLAFPSESQPFVLNEHITKSGSRYFYVTNQLGTSFYF